MIVTLVTAGVCGLLYLILSIRVVQIRARSRVLIGDGGDADLLQRIRAHANFAEYVPICLILIAALELSYQNAPLALYWVGGALVAARICHAIGMSRADANPWRAIGAVGTWLVMGALGLWAISLAITG
jgi:hypothetical protein